MSDMKKVISTTSAPAAIGPYSQAVETGNMIFLSGQLPIDPKTGIMPEGIKAQTRQSFANVNRLRTLKLFWRRPVIRSNIS